MFYPTSTRRLKRSSYYANRPLRKESAEPRYRRSVPLYVALADVPAEVEVLVYTPEEVQEWSQVPQAFVTTAVREGRTLYERPRRT